MNLETQTKRKIDPLDLDTLWERLQAPQEASGSDLVRLSKLVTGKRNKGLLSFNRVLKAMPYFSSPACNTCQWRTRCPYFYQDGVCVALTKLLDTNERRLDRFVVTGPLLYDLKVKRSVALTEAADGYTLKVILLTTLLLVLLQKHTQFKDPKGLRTKPVKTKLKDPENKGTIFPAQRRSVAEAEKVREERAQFLGTTSHHRRLSREIHAHTRFKLYDPE